MSFAFISSKYRLVFFLLKFLLNLSVWFRSAGQKRGKGGDQAGGGRERDPCGGGQDGWTAGSHAKERKEGGREENWIEVKESKMRTRNELHAGGGGRGHHETSLIFLIACELIHLHYHTDTHSQR